MDTADPPRRGVEKPDSPVSRRDFRFTRAERWALQAELAAVFSNPLDIEAILSSIDFRRERISASVNSSAKRVWRQILLVLQHGEIVDGNFLLLSAAIRSYPDNPVFRRLAETYLGAPAEPAAAPERLAAGTEQEAEPATCHVIVRASTEEVREQAEQVLSELGLDPQEQWSTAYAVSFRVDSDSTDDIRRELEQTDLDWTLVPPGQRDYLLRALYVEGPDGRRFRVSDAPAQQTVGNLAAEVIDQYGSDLPGHGRAVVVDRVNPDGQGHRLAPDATLEEAAVSEGDRMRVGFEPTSGGLPADDSSSLGRRYLLARCPDVVPVGKPFSLLASIIMDNAGAAARLQLFSVPPEGRDILLVLNAPGLWLLGDHRRTVRVPTAGDSDPVMFELRADDEGPRSISITAWLDGSYLGELLVEVTADRSQVGGVQREFREEIDAEANQGAVSLVVRYDPDLRAYRFEFRDEDNPAEVVSSLSFEPRQRIERLLADLDRLAEGRGGYSADQARDYLVNAGAELWRELVPVRLREQFWERQHRIRQLTILADKDTVPWELLYPRDRGHDAGFLVQQFPVTRGIFGRRPAPSLSLWPARFVLPDGSLPEAETEIRAMRRLLDPSQLPEVVVSNLAQLSDLIQAGDFGLLHFACHNRFEPDDEASIMLGSTRFTPRLMTTAVIDEVLARSAPTVFMNACRSAGLAPTYNRLDGWAGKFLEAGAGAFIGSQWAVSDGAAREFAEELYARLTTGAPLGQAMMDARAKAATHAADPTWLAYSAYGNPRAKVTLPGA